MLLHLGALAIYGTLSILIAEIPSQCSGASLSKRNPNLEGIYSMFKGPEGSMKSVHQTLAEQIGVDPNNPEQVYQSTVKIKAVRNIAKEKLGVAPKVSDVGAKYLQKIVEGDHEGAKRTFEKFPRAGSRDVFRGISQLNWVELWKLTSETGRKNLMRELENEAEIVQEVDTAAYLHRGMTNADMEDFRRFLIRKKRTEAEAEEEVLHDLPGDEKLSPQEKIKKQRERKVNPLYDEWKKGKKPVRLYLLRWWQKFVRGSKAIYRRFMDLFRKKSA
ncbi:hypothetical protein PGT21_023695 [Puccinia graminis f. sp. tritici]|uniref:Uncharacterized protein n=1 Tax=Puccinia graminis f. sp. tritici TaxID=56615 RepID=A0A5B0RDK0_PUCGR|nr:hypothetical protein PGT21_023695 [Puccinia graminis f. sp. tritici]KAA1123502.1 hypothetical protein PGTUg99_021785 [Puccinia graminis f. sp. tritici]